MNLLEDIFFPDACVLCGDPTFFLRSSKAPLCSNCENSLEKINNPVCSVCGIPLVSEDSICTRCRDRDFIFESNHSFFPYRGQAKKLYQLYKFEKHKALVSFYSAVLGQYLKNIYPDIPVVPAPYRKSSKKTRGWDHIELITDRISRIFNLGVEKILGRKEGNPQKKLSFEEREKNLKGAIYFKKSGNSVPETVILVDDVFTTGATAQECSRILRENGVKKIRVATILIDL